MINKWVREERLEFSSAEESGLNCEKCRKPIATGRFCDNCKAELRSEFRSAMPHEYKVSKIEKKDENSTKMRFLFRRNNSLIPTGKSVGLSKTER